MRFGGLGRGRSQRHDLQGLAFLQGTRLWQVQGRSARASRVPSVALVLELSQSRETVLLSRQEALETGGLGRTQHNETLGTDLVHGSRQRPGLPHMDSD